MGDRDANRSHENLVVGIGSPHGDDRVGWCVIDALRQYGDVPADMANVSEVMQLLDQINGHRRLWLIDACMTAVVPGTVRRFEWPDTRIATERSASTHGFDLSTALELAESLDRLPEHVVLFAVEIEICEPETELSAAVNKAVREVARQIVDETAS